MDSYRNADGTYNGVKFLAAWSGLSEAEVAWTAARIRELIQAGKTAAEAKALVKAEALTKPWLDQAQPPAKEASQ